MPEIIRELTGFAGRACLVRHRRSYFVVSSVDVPFSGPETLVFKATKDGDVTEWSEVAGGRGMSREAAIADLGARHA